MEIKIETGTNILNIFKFSSLHSEEYDFLIGRKESNAALLNILALI